MGSEENHFEVRDMLIRFQNLNQTSFQPFLTSVNSATIQEHISSMLLPNKWGTHIEILAAATIYQVPVYCCVHSPVPSDYVAPHWVCVKPVRPKEKSFSYPDLAGSSLEDVPSPNHFELCYTKAMQSRLPVSRQLHDENGCGREVIIHYSLLFCMKSSLKKEKNLKVHENTGKRR